MSRIEKALENAVRRREPLQAPEPIQQTPRREGLPLTPSNPRIVGFGDQTAFVAEEYRKLRSILLQLTKRQTYLNTLMVTSSESGEGKSLTATNLGLVLAQDYNHTVLLIDGDLRRPSLHDYLGVKPPFGLADCLLDGVDVSRALMPLDNGKLTLLAAGRKTDNPAELLSSDKMKTLMREVKGRYHDRYIIIDTPPVLPFAETHSISTYIDGVLFIVKEGTAMTNVAASLDILKDGNVLGIVYNGARKDRTSDRYSHYYDQYYRRTESAGISEASHV